MSDTATQRESRLRRALLHRIHRRFQTVTQNIQIGELNFTFTRIADPDRVLDEVAAEEDRREKLRGTRTKSDELHLPYWAEFWDSALGIGQHLVAANPQSPLRGRRVLDLGCGMGFAGTVAGRLGADVLFADLEPAALLFAKLNNLPLPLADGGDGGGARSGVGVGGSCAFRRLDWRVDRLDESFDLIIGADILYERAQWEHLEPFWRTHLAPTGSLLLGEPGRQTGDLFIPWIRDRGWSLQQSEQPVVTRPKPIRIFQLRLP